jgi:hypothetical protein
VKRKVSAGSLRTELRWARREWPHQISAGLRCQLKHLVSRYRLSVAEGDLTIIGGKWYVTHSGLLRLARKSRCRGISTQVIGEFCDKTLSRWAFRATVFTSRTCRGFVGYGDADPSNVSPVVRGAEMRVAETRAVNRALRKAYGIGTCSVEEIGSVDRSRGPDRSLRTLPPESVNGSNGQGGNGNGTRLRDRLCQIIRQHKLDAELVKAYAVDFCGTKTLRQASREQVENFVAHLADWAAKDRNALLCQLNSYVHEKDGAA